MTFENQDDGNHGYVKQLPFKATLELYNGDSHFSEEEANLCESVVYIAIVIVIAMLINIYFFANDMIAFDRNDNPLLATLVALSQLGCKTLFTFFYMVQY